MKCGRNIDAVVLPFLYTGGRLSKPKDAIIICADAYNILCHHSKVMDFNKIFGPRAILPRHVSQKSLIRPQYSTHLSNIFTLLQRLIGLQLSIKHSFCENFGDLLKV
jgi:hypothetical protein